MDKAQALGVKFDYYHIWPGIWAHQKWIDTAVQSEARLLCLRGLAGDRATADAILARIKRENPCLSHLGCLDRALEIVKQGGLK